MTIKTVGRGWRRGATIGVAAILAAALASCSGAQSGATHTSRRSGGTTAAPGSLVGSLIAASTDLGASRARDVDVLVTLRGSARPTRLDGWAAAHRLGVRWTRGENYAIVHGTAAAMSAGFAISIHDYRSSTGKRFYATTRYARVPTALRTSITGVGSILSDIPKTTVAGTSSYHDDVPAGGLSPSQMLRAYDATSLAQAGDTGKGKTVVFFELDGFAQADLDKFAQISGTSRFTPVLDSTMPGKVEGETDMDLQVVHSIVPDAKLVVYNIATAWAGTSAADYIAHIAASYRTVEQKYPGSVWSISITSACERLFNATDLAPMESALQQATAQGTSVFMSSGDTGGLECKAARQGGFGSPPEQQDIGVSAINTPPSVTGTGGTQLDTDANGGWISEEAWTQFATQQGTSGGPSIYVPRPSWQTGPELSTVSDSHRLTPDVSADADPSTGLKIVVNGAQQLGGGTSQAAPIWAGLTVMMNQYLEANGGKALGDINPLLYKAAETTPSAFHDVVLGGDMPYTASKGFDYLTGLGSPDVGVLVKALQAAQKAGS